MNLTKFLPYLLHRADSEVVTAFDHVFKKQGISVFEWRILACLAHFGEMRFGELASSVSIEPPTLVRLLSDMEEKALITKQVSPSDKRVRLVSSTAKGADLVEKILPTAEQHEKTLLFGFTEDETYMLRRMLERIYQNMHGIK